MKEVEREQEAALDQRKFSNGEASQSFPKLLTASPKLQAHIYEENYFLIQYYLTMYLYCHTLSCKSFLTKMPSFAQFCEKVTKLDMTSTNH
jgi:hypothetical protein